MGRHVPAFNLSRDLELSLQYPTPAAPIKTQKHVIPCLIGQVRGDLSRSRLATYFEFPELLAIRNPKAATVLPKWLHCPNGCTVWSCKAGDTLIVFGAGGRWAGTCPYACSAWFRGAGKSIPATEIKPGRALRSAMKMRLHRVALATGLRVFRLQDWRHRISLGPKPKLSTTP